MIKYAAIVEYDGTGFHGWQTQPNLRNVQDCTADALSKIADHPITVICAGRTDVGVHALGQVIHFLTDADRSINEWHRGTNFYLPEDIAIKYVQQVEDDFHARFSALSRSYRYLIFNGRQRSALRRYFSTWMYKPLNAAAMHRAAQVLVGEHDFSSFRAAGCQSKSPMRHISSISVQRYGEMVLLDVTANAFVQHMVRNIVGTLLAVGTGEAEELWVAEVLARYDRTCAGITAPGNGLYLTHIEYEPRYGFPDSEVYSNHTAILPIFF